MLSEPRRPDPDALLASIQEEDKKASRGRLKVFFGFSPGVGKTYAMLESARRLLAAGTESLARAFFTEWLGRGGLFAQIAR